MTHAKCAVCITYQLFECFRFLPCGHGFCEECMREISRPGLQHLCPACRKKFRKGQEFKIHVEFPHGNEASSAVVEDQLDSCTAESSAEDVTKAAESLEGMANGVNNQQAESILQSVEHFKQRIIPIFEQCQTYKAEIAALKQNLDISSQDKRQLRVQLQDADRLKMELETAQAMWRKAADKVKSERELAKNAMQLLEQANTQADAAKRGIAGLEKRLADEETTTKDLRRLLQRQAINLQKNAEKMNDLQTQLMVAKNELEIIEKGKQDARCSQGSDGPLEEHGGWLACGELHETPSTSMRTPLRNPPSHNAKHRRITRSPDQTPMTPISIEPKDFFEGLPGPRFGSDWTLRDAQSTTRGVKRKTSGADENVKAVPVQLDRRGKPLSAVQLGPKRGVRVQLK